MSEKEPTTAEKSRWDSTEELVKWLRREGDLEFAKGGGQLHRIAADRLEQQQAALNKLPVSIDGVRWDGVSPVYKHIDNGVQESLHVSIGWRLAPDEESGDEDEMTWKPFPPMAVFDSGCDIYAIPFEQCHSTKALAQQERDKWLEDNAERIEAYRKGEREWNEEARQS